MDAPKTLQTAIQFFTDYENCRKFMIAIRWEDGVLDWLGSGGRDAGSAGFRFALRGILCF
jgi:hypothetical protein